MVELDLRLLWVVVPLDAVVLWLVYRAGRRRAFRRGPWPSMHAQHGVLLEQLKEVGADADSASMQAAFWRHRAIELGAEPGEWRVMTQALEDDQRRAAGK